MRKTIVALATTCALLMVVPAAQAASIQGEPRYQRMATGEWSWRSPFILRIWFSRKETETAYRKVLVIGGTATLTTYICGLIPQKLAEWACKIIIPVKATDLLQNVTEAHRRKVCLTATNNVLKAPGNLDFNDDGGSRCK